MKKPNNKLTLIAVTVIAIAIGVAAFIRHRSNSTLAITYNKQFFSCKYVQGKDYARCLSVDSPSCYGYYKLKTSSIFNGIIPKETNNTCEGYIPGDFHYFNRDGDIIPL